MALTRFCPLFSGSSGNCTYVGTGAVGGAHVIGVLVDAGVSARRIVQALRDRGIDINDISAILVTHEHSDHIKGLLMLQKYFRLPVYATEGTCRELRRMGIRCETPPPEVAGMGVTPFATPHDARESCGFLLRCGERTVAIATDLGHVTDTVRGALRGADLVMLESNHDVDMLTCGAYPYYLKARISSEVGHLSNAVCAGELYRLAMSGTTRFVLGHLSRENNRPQLALETARAGMGGLKENKDYILAVATPDATWEVLRF
ncbi:MAG: MBL fold metallo-hydrolase [Oscillospiraceae bacterium]|nr:MBL fold metallo-hydrolase [Oscillospiraceae bacterium]